MKTIQIALVTETWLKDLDEILLTALDPNKKEYKFSNLNRENKHEEGIRVLYDKPF